ncbi:hypothetical protein OMR07_05725 [Methylobacterium organophilum]|nr:hypothetical protein [Methylobacterium organophilum]
MAQIGALDLLPAAADVLPLAQRALVFGERPLHFRHGSRDAGLQRIATPSRGGVAAQQHRRDAAVLLGQLDQAGQWSCQRGRHQLAFRTLDGAIQLTGDGQHQAGEGKKHKQADHTELDWITEPIHQQLGRREDEFHGEVPGRYEALHEAVRRRVAPGAGFAAGHMIFWSWFAKY